MKDKREQNIYRSFEQLRSELFPKLVSREITNRTKQNTEKFGSCLANKAIDQILAASPN